MAERGEHSNKHGSHRHEAETHYNDRFEHQHRQGYGNEYRRHHKHHAYGWRHNRHHRYFDKHAYRHGHRKHHNHRYYAQNHNYYQPARILFGLQGGDFRFLFRD